MKKETRKKLDPFEEDFLRIQEEMERMVNDILTLHYRDEQQARKHSPYVYGFSMKVSQEGKPEIKDFGTFIPHQKEWKEKQEIEISREPMIDIIEGKEELTVIAELPGVQKEDIHISTTEESMVLHTPYHHKNYKKEIWFPCKVKSDSAKAIYNNGVLEVKLKRMEPKHEHGKEVKIE
ncbi:MAG: archaeal heat shock protein Hsp20 [Candidatus Micrarchaeota archaeon]